MKTKERKYLPEITELIDRLSIVTLKSIKLGCNDKEKKDSYEKECDLIMNDINLIMEKNKNDVKDWGRVIRGIQMDMLSNECIWQNETSARTSGYNDGNQLLFTHSLNAVRMHGGNMVAQELGTQVDLNSDRLNNEICIQNGYNFSGCFHGRI